VSLPMERMNMVADANSCLARVPYSSCNSTLRAAARRLIGLEVRPYLCHWCVI
jgi:hypothetical protein